MPNAGKAISKGVEGFLKSISPAKAGYYLKQIGASTEDIAKLTKEDIGLLNREYTSKLKGSNDAAMGFNKPLQNGLLVARDMFEEAHATGYKIKTPGAQRYTRSPKDQLRKNMKANVLNNIEQSRIARESSNFGVQSTEAWKNKMARKSAYEARLQQDVDAIKGVDPSVTMNDVKDSYRERVMSSAMEKRRNMRSSKEEQIANEMNLGADPLRSNNGSSMSQSDVSEAFNSVRGSSNVSSVSNTRAGQEGSFYSNKHSAKIDQQTEYMHSNSDKAAVGSKLGYSEEEWAQMANDKRGEAINSWGTHRKMNPSIMEKATYNKVPQAAAGIGMTAWLVSRLSENKGEMSNSQLYGQQPY